MDSALQELQNVSGEMTVQRGTVTSSGVQSGQDPMTSEITFDQAKFLSALRAVEHPQFVTAAAEEKLCVVCVEREKELALVPCGHVCLCSVCFRSVTSCPMCRAEFTSSVRIYL